MVAGGAHRRQCLKKKSSSSIILLLSYILQHGCFAVRECVIGCNTNFEFLATDMVVAAITHNTYILECPICFRHIIILLKADSRLTAFKSQQEKEEEEEEEEEWLTSKKIFFFAVFFARFTTERKKERNIDDIHFFFG
jgi:hypothetical protein